MNYIYIFLVVISTRLPAQWAQVNAPASTYFSSIKFISPTIGFCVGQHGVLKTSDAGDNWSVISSSPVAGRSIFFVNATLGFLIDNTFLYKTSNGGTTWVQAFDFTSSGETLRDLYFTTTNIGYIVTSFYNNPAASFIYKTTNGGTSWTKTNTFTGMADVESIKFIGTNIGFVVGYGGRIIKTVNAGATWSLTQLPSGADLSDVSIVNSNVIYAVGTAVFPGSEVVKTIDGGSTWQVLSTNPPGTSTLRGVYFHSVDTGYAAGDNGRIIKTFDGGASWQVSPSPVNTDFYSTYFINNNVGFVAGDNGSLLKISNGGVAGIHNNSQSKFKLFPNPVVSTITIESNTASGEKYNLSFTNLIGEVVLSENIDFLNLYKLEVTKLKAGIYFLTLQNNEEKITEKIIIQH